MKLALQEAVAATRAEVLEPQRAPADLHVVTDTRALRAGDTFLALRGERFDGHTYVAQALSHGASAIIIDDARARPEGVAALLVRDTKRAYMDLAKAARDNFLGRVVAITGSNGKTTTKHLLSQLLQGQYGEAAILSSSANENNEIGVSKLMLALDSQHRFAVVEMGARHPGEIADLVKIAQPHVGVLTNIGEAHLEIFGSLEQLVQTKWGLFSRGALPVLNARDQTSRERAENLSAAAMWFGTGKPDLPGVWIVDPRTIVLTDGKSTQSFATDVRLPGEHNRSNLAAAASAALLFDVPLEKIAHDAPNLQLPPGRYERIAFPHGPRVIYDAYNASASGTIATLAAFANEQGTRRIAVIGSMAELGKDAPALHERVGSAVAQAKIDILLAGGDFAESLIEGARAAGMPQSRTVLYDGNAQAAAWLRENTTSADVVLIKGSRKYAMEQIVELLRSAS